MPPQDVLTLVPPTSEIAHLDRVWKIDARTSPLEMLDAWHPTDEHEQQIRAYLIAFGRRVLAAGKADVPGRRRRLTSSDPPTA